MKYLLLAATSLCLIMFQNCAPSVKFEEELVQASAADTYETTEEFKSDAQNAPLDMIWVIDNSGSMSEEATHVRNNFENFLTVLNQNTNFRLLVISNTGTYGVTIPSQFSSNNHIQAQITVGSTNGPEILINTLKDTRYVPANFFRENAKKVVIFVTDDESQVTSANILSRLSLNKSLVSVFAFIGLGNIVSPCQEKTGAIYKDLATKTGGKSYNICDLDWSASFDDLLNNAITEAKRNFTLNSVNVTQIVSVNVDGKPLPAKSYTLTGQSVTIAKDVVLNINSVISVTYTAVK